MVELDLNFVRKNFPAFSSTQLKQMSFFENAGGSFSNKFVIDRLMRFYVSRKVQPYAPYSASKLGGEEMDEARNGLSRLLNIPPQTLSFGPSTSQNTYVLANAFQRMLSTGRETIIVTNQDHEANSGAWRRLEKEGFTIKEWKVDSRSGSLYKKDLIDLLDEKVLLVAFPHCSNIIGEINPVQEICKIIRSYGAYSCVDGVSFAPHGLPNLGKLEPDIYLFSSYKTYGPHLGLMYLSSNLNMALENQGHYFNANKMTMRFTPAGPDHAQIAASAGITDYFDAMYKHHFDSNANPAETNLRIQNLQREHESKLLEPLLEYLSGKNCLRVLGSVKVVKRVPTVAIDIGDKAHQVACKLAEDGVMAASGDFYAVRLLEALGVNVKHGVLRLSFVHYTSESDIERLITSLNNQL